MSNAPSDFWSETNLSVMPGEELLYSGEPLVAQMKRMANVTTALVTLFFWPLVCVWPWAFWTNRLSAERHRYFVTNRRVIVTNGLFGYSTRSVPLERVSDVQIGCTLMERWFGLRSIVVRDMTGEAQGGARMRGVPNAQRVQELILSEVQRVNQVIANKESAPVTSGGAPAVAGSGGAEQRQILGLLERIAVAVERK